MDWESTSTNTNTLKQNNNNNNTNSNIISDNSINSNSNQTHQTNSIASAANIESISINNDEFQNLNTSNFDTNLNLNLTQLNQLINLNNNDDLIDSNDNKNSYNDNNMIDLDKDSDLNANGIIVDDNKLNSTTSNMLMLNSNDTVNNDELKFITDGENNVDDDEAKKEDIDSFLPNLSPPTVSNNIDEANTPANTTNNNEQTALTDEKSTKQSNSTRFNYKCKYCLYLTKFKAHIIEHMQTEHKLNLMQCPEQTCNKKFKDEWKLKRHLLSNRDHKPLPNFKNLTDVMRQYIDIEPQKQGFPCALCQYDQNDNLIVSNCEPDQQQSYILSLLNKNTDNYLYLNTYDQLKEHTNLNHPHFNIDSYFVCKQCGQVFINRYKLSCHLFNVHSGKRKRRPRVNKNDKTTNDLLKLAAFNTSLTTDGISLDDILNRLGGSENSKSRGVKRLGKKAMKLKSLGLPERKYLCVVCNRRFKRTRDLQIHVQIMHKNITEQQKQQIQVEIQKTNLLIKKPSLLLAAQLQMQMTAQGNNNTKSAVTTTTTSSLNKPVSINHTNIIKNSIINDNNIINGKVCFICKKVFKPSSNALANNTQNTSVINASINKSFIRHMQIQHGLNEKGERLIECPVCEKSFFNKQQMERHMHTHEVWVEIKNATTSSISEEVREALNENVPSARASIKLLSMPDYRDKHSILYCHECIECNLYFKSIKVLANHKREVHNLKPVYKCAQANECNHEFDSVQSFLEHANVHIQKNIMCSRCKIKFNNKNLLRHHMKNVHYNHKLNSAGNTSGSSASSCNSSNSSTASKTTQSSKKILNPNNIQKMKNNNNKDIKLLTWSMPTTSTAFNSNTINPRPPIIYLTADANNLISNANNNDNLDLDSQNKQLSQKQQNKFNCPTCNKEYSSRNSLHNHLATHNTNDLRLFMCDLCGNSFKTRKDLSRHAALHDFSKNKTCQECGMTFKTSFHLKRHSLTRHSNIRPFKCNHCEMTFARKDKLKQHEAKHINHPLYQCSQCNKGFYRKEHLKDHEISKHSKQYPFSCEHCNKGFVHAKDLHRHIRVRHLGVILNNTIVTNEQAHNKKSTINSTINNNNNNNNNKPIISNNINTDIEKLNKKGANKNAINMKLNIANNQLIQTPQTVHLQPQHQIISASSNDFKSKKISSILKSTMYMSNNALANQQNHQQQQQQQQIKQTLQVFQQQPQIQQLNQQQTINLGIPQTIQITNLESQKFQQPSQIYLNNQPLSGTTLQINPIQITLDNYKPDELNFVNNGQQFISIPIYTNNANEPLNIFTTTTAAATPVHSSMINPTTIISKINPINTVNTANLINFNSINASSLPKVINKPEQPTHIQQQTKKIPKKIKNKNINELTNAIDARLNSQTKQGKKKSVNSSIDNTIDSILSLITGNDEPAMKSHTPSVLNEPIHLLSGTSTPVSNNNQFVRSYKCSYCQKDFFYENHLKKHILSKHSQTPLFSCSMCNQGFSTKATAKSHVENSHATYTCPVCYKKFNNKSHTQRHIQNIHKTSADSQVTDLKPIKESRNEARVIDLSSTNMIILNQMQLENNNAISGKAEDLFNLNLNKENEQSAINNSNVSLNNDNANINLNDINLNFVDQQNFWSSLSSATSMLSVNIANNSGNNNIGQSIESINKTDNLNQLNGSYFISQ